jgi:hypothetical protein
MIIIRLRLRLELAGVTKERRPSVVCVRYTKWIHRFSITTEWGASLPGTLPARAGCRHRAVPRLGVRSMPDGFISALGVESAVRSVSTGTGECSAEQDGLVSRDSQLGRSSDSVAHQPSAQRH